MEGSNVTIRHISKLSFGFYYARIIVCAFIDEHVHDENSNNNSRPHEEKNLDHRHS